MTSPSGGIDAQPNVKLHTTPQSHVCLSPWWITALRPDPIYIFRKSEIFNGDTYAEIIRNTR